MSSYHHLSLFTGIGGFDLGLASAGIETIAHSEIDKFANRVLAERFKGIPNHGDITEFDARRYRGSVDVVSFGSPCQDLSVAGRRKGLDGSRSGLFFEAARVVDECKPHFAVWENVAGAFSSNAGRDFLAVIDTLADLGARQIGWRVFDSQYTGVPQQRRRVYLVADFRTDCSAEILLEPESCAGHRAPGGAPRQGVAGTLTSRARSAGGSTAGRGSEDDYNLVAIQERAVSENPSAGPDGKGFREDGQAYTLEARQTKAAGLIRPERPRDYLSRFDLDGDTYVVSPTVTSKWAKGGGPAGDETQNLVVSHTLTAESFDAAYDPDRGRGLEVVKSALPPQVFQPRVARNGRGAPSDIVPALSAQAGQTGKGDSAPYVFSPSQITNADNRSNPGPGDPSHTLTSDGKAPMLVEPRYGVRRLTPLECERLQGFPDGWTCLCGADGDMFACKCPDGPRYRALGNAVTVNVPAWWGPRMVKFL